MQYIIVLFVGTELHISCKLNSEKLNTFIWLSIKNEQKLKTDYHNPVNAWMSDIYLLCNYLRTGRTKIIYSKTVN